MDDRNELGARRLHHWSGLDREKDTASLADTIAAVGHLYNRAGSLALHTEDGGLVNLHRNAFQQYINQNVAYTKLVPRNGKWRPEFFTYEFAQKPHYNPSDYRGAPEPPRDQPDLTVLDELMPEVLKRVPRVEERPELAR